MEYYKSDLWANQLVAAILCRLGGLNYDFNYKNRQYTPLQNGGWQQKLFFAARFLGLVRIIQLLCATYRFYFQPNSSSIHKLATYSFLPVVPMCLVLDIRLAQVSGLHCSLMNMFHDRLADGRRTFSSIRRMKTELLVLIFAPCGLMVGPLAALMAYWFDSSLPLLTWSNLPMEFREPEMYWFCVLWDTFWIGALTTILWNCLVAALTFINFLGRELQLLHRIATALTNPKIGMMAKLRLIQQLEYNMHFATLGLNTFNAAGCHLVFMMKQYSMFCTIFSVYLTIIFSKSNFVIAAAAWCTGFPVGLAYIILFDDAFKFPERMNRIRRLCVLGASMLPPPNSIGYYKRLADSIFFKGVKVGSFQVMEREATLNFLNFSASQIAALLLASGTVTSH